MPYRRTPFAQDEWYHIYTRGIDKRTTFQRAEDFHRFKLLLFLANDTKPFEIRNYKGKSLEQIVGLPRRNPLVRIGAYCLMGNHPHLLLQEMVEGGITRFMHKVGTGYTMYFNLIHDRIGNLFVKPFRSRHIANDSRLRYVAQYIHLNPAELYEPKWKQGIVRDVKGLEEKILGYKYSSLPDYYGAQRPERAMLDSNAFEMIGDQLPPLSTVLAEAAEYYAEIEQELEAKTYRDID